MTNAFAPGTVVHRYRLEGVLGAGGMGTVYRARDLETGSPVAVKSLHPQFARRAEHQKRFLREGRAAMATPHPNIVTIHEVFEHDGAPMIAMELLEGESLERLLAREQRMPLDRLARLMVRVTSAVGTAHGAGIVHRDLKPDNIFLTNGDETRVKVLDFGIAKLTATQGVAAETAALTRTGALMGTPFYMSPEQAFGEKKIDQRSDIWSLGIIVYQSLSGVLPTRGASFGDVFRHVVATEFVPIEQLVPGLPADVATLVTRMLRRDPAERPWDLREVHAVLERQAHVSAPAFGMAVAPLFDEWSDHDSALLPAPSAAVPTPTGASVPLSFTPSSMRLSPARPPAGGVTPNGTIALDAPGAAVLRNEASSPEGTTVAGRPPMNSNRLVILAAIAAALFAVLAVAMIFSLR